MAVNRDDNKGELSITDMGVTIRTLLGFAAKGYDLTSRRTWKVVYNGVQIGSVQVRNKDTKGKVNDPNAGSIRKRRTAETATTASADKASDGAGMVVAARPSAKLVSRLEEGSRIVRTDDSTGTAIAGDDCLRGTAHPGNRPDAPLLQRRTQDARRVRVVARNQGEEGEAQGEACGGNCGTCSKHATGSSQPTTDPGGGSAIGEGPEIVGTV